MSSGDGQAARCAGVFCASDVAVRRPEVADLGPGELRVTKDAVLVGTGSHAVALTRVAPAGRRLMDATAWARGARMEEDSVVGVIPAGAES